MGALAGAALVGAAPAGAVESGTALAPGVTYKQFDVQGAKGVAHAHLLTVGLRDKHVRLGLLYPGAVAARATVSRMAEAQGAVAGINGDFFDISESQHPGVEVTGSTDGPAIANGHVLKASVPDGQRFGQPQIWPYPDYNTHKRHRQKDQMPFTEQHNQLTGCRGDHRQDHEDHHDERHDFSHLTPGKLIANN